MQYTHAIESLSFDEIELASAGGSAVHDAAVHVAAISAIVGGVAVGTGAAPVAIGAAVVGGIAGVVAVFVD